MNKLFEYIEHIGKWNVLGNILPATYERLGIVKPRTVDGVNVSGLTIDEEGQLEANIKRSATPEDIAAIGTERASPEAAVTMQNVNDVFQHTTIITKEDFNNIFNL